MSGGAMAGTFLLSLMDSPLTGNWHTGAIIGGIIGGIILIAIIATIIVMVRRSQRKNIDRPPNHKPPPPLLKTNNYSDRSASFSNSVPDPEYLHHETEKEFPMTDVSAYYDDKDHKPSPSSWEDKQTPFYDDRDEDRDQNGMMGEEDMYFTTSSVTRGSSFMSSAVIV